MISYIRQINRKQGARHHSGTFELLNELCRSTFRTRLIKQTSKRPFCTKDF